MINVFVGITDPVAIYIQPGDYAVQKTTHGWRASTSDNL